MRLLLTIVFMVTLSQTALAHQECEYERNRNIEDYRIHYEAILKMFNELYKVHTETVLKPLIDAEPYKVEMAVYNDKDGLPRVGYRVFEHFYNEASYYTWYAENHMDIGWRDIKTGWAPFDNNIFTTKQEAENVMSVLVREYRDINK
jgi:hypothetical protein